MAKQILPVLNFCSKDMEQAKLVLEACAKLDGKRNTAILLAYPKGLDSSGVEAAASNAFVTVGHFEYDDWGGEKKWPAPQNWAWQTVARWMATNGVTKEHCGWMWWEADSTPIRSGWLETLSAAYVKGKQLFGGVLCENPGVRYMNGVGIYPFDVIEPLANVTALWNVGVAFDIAAGPAVMRHFTDLSDLMIHVRKLKGGVSGVTFDRLDYQLLLERHPKAVFYHGCDASLPMLIAGKQIERKKRPEPSKPKYPSVTEQTPWESGLFTFPASLQPTVYYNCSVSMLEGEPHLFTRRQRFMIGEETRGSTNKNDLAIFRIRQNMTLDPNARFPATPQRFTYEQWEDPRAMVGSDGRCYVSFATWVHGEPWKIRQSLTRYSSDTDSLEVISEPVYGGNHYEPRHAKGHEKNWCWFEDVLWHFVYTVSPHVVVNAATRQEFRTNPTLPWKHGTPRGGTPPMLHGGEYYCFFHSSEPDLKYRRRYFMGAYTFEAKPPYRILRMTPEPLLVGSEADFNNLDSPLVVFPNGALIEKQNQIVSAEHTGPNETMIEIAPRPSHWLVVFGVNDEHSGWIRIPVKELEERMVKV